MPGRGLERDAPAAEVQDEVDLARGAAGPPGDLDTGQPLVGKVIDLGERVGGGRGPGTRGGGRIGGAFEGDEPGVGGLDEAFESGGAGVEFSREAVGEFAHVAFEIAEFGGGVGAGTGEGGGARRGTTGGGVPSPPVGEEGHAPGDGPHRDRAFERAGGRAGWSGAGREGGEVRGDEGVVHGRSVRAGQRQYHRRMAASRVTLRPSGRSATARAIVRAWRELTGGAGVRDGARRTLVACSGGADSSALLLALGTRPENVVAAHVVHDLRPRREALRDAARVRGLARALGVAYARGEVRVRGLAGNAEANARAARYAALVRLARAHGCRYVCTAHHADDLAETVLMRLLRGSGPRGLAGMRGTRPLVPGVTLVRPMLGVTRAQAEALCTLAGWAWSEDATNKDITRLRAAVRARVLPVLAEIAPGYQSRVARSAGLLDACARLLRARARRLLPAKDGACELQRARLRRVPEIVAGEAVRLAHARAGGGAGADRMSQRVLAQVVRAARDGVGGTRVFSVGGVRIEVTRERVTLRAIETPGATRGASAGRPRRRSRASGSAGAGSTRRRPSGRARAGAFAAGAGTAARTRRPSRSR